MTRSQFPTLSVYSASYFQGYLGSGGRSTHRVSSNEDHTCNGSILLDLKQRDIFMNKLRKKPPPRQNPDPQYPTASTMSTAVAISPAVQSRTMMFARANTDVSSLPSSSLLKNSNLATTYAKSKQQMTNSEQYWAARALTAETMLTANAQYQREIRNMSESERIKRSVCVWLFHSLPRID